jgi:hypothetical protein
MAISKKNASVVISMNALFPLSERSHTSFGHNAMVQDFLIIDSNIDTINNLTIVATEGGIAYISLIIFMTYPANINGTTRTLVS